MAPLQVLTFNTWGLWLVSKKRYNRILHLAEFLANDTDRKHKLDVVLLQEVWVDSDARILATAAEQGGLIHCMHFRSGVFGSGLLTLSRYPIVEAAFHQYNCAGDPASITCGDYLAAKGVGWTRLATPSGPLDAFNTHLHANYSHKYGSSGMPSSRSSDTSDTVSPYGNIPPPAVDEFAAFRMAQVLELARFVCHISKGAGTGSLGVVLAGDLNCEPKTLECQLLRSLLPQLHDAWVETHGSQADDEGHTCNAACSSFKPKRQRPSRIDYVLTTLGAAGCELALQQTPEGHSFSDHIAVQARLELPSAAAAAASKEFNAQQQQQSPLKQREEKAAGRRVALLQTGRCVLEDGVRRASEASAGHVLFAIIMTVQALCLCFFEPVMSYMGRPVNPITRQLLPAVVLVLAAGAGLFLLTGMVADAGQARALQQALQQLQVTLASCGGSDDVDAATAAGAVAAGAGSRKTQQKAQKRR